MAHPSTRVARRNAASASGSPERAASATIFAVRRAGSPWQDARSRRPLRSESSFVSTRLWRTNSAMDHPLARDSTIRSGSTASSPGRRCPISVIDGRPLAHKAAVQNTAAPHARSHRHVEDGVLPPARSDTALGQRSHVAIVSQNRLQTRISVEPVGQREVHPPGYVVALAHPALRSVHRAAEADADPADRMSRRQFGGLLPDLVQDAGGAGRGIDVAACQGDQGSPVSGADPQLEFGPADFDAQEHGITKSPEDAFPLLSFVFAVFPGDWKRASRPDNQRSA